MDELDLKAILLTQLARDHFGGNIDDAIADVRANQAHLVDQENQRTKAAIAAEAAIAAAAESGAGVVKPS